jgi:hypothetical protein
MEHVFCRWAGIFWLFFFMSVSVLELPASVAFLGPSFISRGYLISPCAAILNARLAPLPACSVDFW